MLNLDTKKPVLLLFLFLFHAFASTGFAAAASQNETDTSALQPGDVLVFQVGKGRHAGVYMGGNEFVHIGVKSGVSVQNLAYWTDHPLISVRRVLKNPPSHEAFHAFIERHKDAEYVSGKVGPDQFDCSAFVTALLNHFDRDLNLSRKTTITLQHIGEPVAI